MKKAVIGLFVIIFVIFVGLITAMIILGASMEAKNKPIEEPKEEEITNTIVEKDYFDTFDIIKTIDGKKTKISLKYYKDSYKFEEKCFKIYFDVFVNDKLINPYRENSPYEVDLTSLVYTSNYCAYDNSDPDNDLEEIRKVNSYISDNTYVLRGDKDYIAILIPTVNVSSNNEIKLAVFNSEGKNIYSYYLLKQKEEITSYNNCSISYDNKLYGTGINTITSDENSLYFLSIDSHLSGGTKILAENKIVITSDDADIVTVNKCSGK